MELTDLKIKGLKAKPKTYLVRDGGGLNLMVHPSGKMSWIYRYRVNGNPGKMHLGRYPDVSLKRAREKRNEQRNLVNDGKSPAQEKKLAKVALAASTTVQEFGEKFFAEQIEPRWKNPINLRAYLDNDICPKLGAMPVKDVSPVDIQNVVFGKRDRGAHGKKAPAAARQLRSFLKQIFDYAVAKQIRPFNPVLSLPAKYVGKVEARTRSLSPEEIRRFMHTIYGSDISRCLKLAFHLILITLVRKNELLKARWEHLNFEAAEWTIPKEHSKNRREHIIYLSSQALDLFRELQTLAGGSPFVLPGRLSLNRPYAPNVLNETLTSLSFDMPHFTVHDLRRTASTILHEKEFPSDVIETAMNHTIGGVRGVYNKAKYAEPRKKMLQFWGDFIEGLASEKKVLVGNFMRA